MKRLLVLLICLTVTGIASACEKNSTPAKHTNPTTGIRDIIESRKEAEDKKNASSESVPETTAVTSTETTPELTAETAAESSTVHQAGVAEGASVPSETKAAKSGKSKNGIDVDLTNKSANMVYMEVYNMMVKPEDYVGKTIKMKGTFAQYHDEATDKYYFACIIKDAMACCSQGIEFALNKKYKFPKDYPQKGDKICVVGVFATYKEGKDTYCTLKNARLVK